MSDETRAALYVRVSTLGQSVAPQEAELRRFAQRRGWTVCKVYRDEGESGAKTKRPGLDQLMTDCRQMKFDLVVVWRFDRFARSLKHLIDALQEFKERGVQFVSYTEQVDTSTANGELFFNIVGSFAQFERALVRERVQVGLAHARSQGKKLGRPPVRRLTPEEQARLRSERRSGESLRTLAKKFGVTLWTAHSLCKAVG